MTPQELHPSVELEHRIEVLESKLARLRMRTPNSRARRFAFLVGYALVPTLVFAGFALAQPELAPAPGQPEPGNIWKDGDTTFVVAPFKVVDASGTVLLSVTQGTDLNALTSIGNLGGHGGSVLVNSPGGTNLAMLGVNVAGHGTVFANDKDGKTRAYIQGVGAIYVHNQSGKQVAGVIATSEQKGRVAVWGSGGSNEKVAAIDEASNGSGVINIYDKAAQRVVVLGQSPEGKGLVQVVDKELSMASLSINNAGAGQLLLSQADGSLGLEAVGTSQRAGHPAGGAIAAFDDGGRAIAGLGVGPDGKGLVSVISQGRAVAELVVSDASAGKLILRNSEGNEGLSAIGASSEGPGGGLIASNGSGDPIVALGSSRSGKGSVVIYEKDHAAAELSANDTGAGQLTLSDTQGQTALDANAGSTELPGGAVVAFNKEGIPVASLGSSSDGKGQVTISEAVREVAILTSNQAKAGALFLMTSDGKVGLDAEGQEAAGQGGGSLTAFNGTGDVVASLGTSDNGKGRIAIVDQDKSVALMGVNPEGGGGMFNAFNNQGVRVSGMGSEQGKGRLAVYSEKAGSGLATLSEDPKGAGVVWVKNADDRIVAGIMGGNDNAGAVLVMDSSGKPASEMSAAGGLGQVAIWSSGSSVPAAVMTRSDTGGVMQVSNSQFGVAYLAVGPAGAGQLQLHDASGNNMVEAGTADDRGIVRVGPLFKCSPIQAATPVMAFGVPDCILGATPK